MEMNNEIFRELITERKKISSQLSEIEQKYKMKKYPNDFMAQMISSFELGEIENDPEFGKEYKCLGEEYSSLSKKIAAYVRANRWQVSIWNEENPFGKRKTIIGNYADKDTAWAIAKLICGDVKYDDSVPEV